MKKYTRLTFITSAMMMLSTQAVFAQTTTDEKPSEVTTSEVTTVAPTTQEETTTTTTTEQVRTRRKREVSNEETQSKEVENSTYTGFVTRDGVTYYHINKVPITRQWKQIDQKWYYFDEEGKMLKNTTFDGYAFDHEGVMGTNQWMTIQGERYYVTESGKYLKDTWKQFDGKWYYFDRAGRMQKNTLVNGYLMGDNGALVTNRWVTFNEKWYYAQEDGKAVQNAWKQINGKWYMFHQDGTMYANEFNWNYYHKASGEMADDEWVFDTTYNSWFYIKPGGTYARNEWKDAFYLKSGGYMAKSEFIYDSNYKATYYLEETGKYASDKWMQLNGKWYHFQKAGEMDKNKWVGSYYVKDDGTMADKEWIFDKGYNNWFYIQEGGLYVRNKWLELNQEWYFFKNDGQMAQREWVGDYYLKADGKIAKNQMIYDQKYGSSYYLESDGRYAKNKWVKVGQYWYYFLSNGKVARQQWIDGKYYVFDNGKMATGKHIIDHYEYVFDDNGNVLSKKAVDIGWVEKNGKRYFYNGASQRLGDEHTKKVMDVSEHQGHISNWESIIRENGIDAVIVRIGYTGAEDKHLANNIRELNRLGVPYGIYLYTYASNDEDGVKDANLTLELIKRYNIKPTYPIYYDIEDWRYENGSKVAPTDTATWVKIWKAYQNTMAKAGYTNVRIYSYQYLLQNRLNHPDILKYVDWVAAYTPQLRYQLPYSQPSWGWQYTSTEYVKGLGLVDMSVWFGR